MTDILDNISQDSLIVVCIALCAIAVLIAIVIVFQLLNSRKKVEVLDEIDDEEESNDVVLNIKPDENITYEELDDESQRQKAKEELKELKEKLRNEELNRAKEKNENAIVQDSAPLVATISTEEKKSIVENRDVMIPLEEEIEQPKEEEKTKEIVGLPEEIAKIENKAKEEKELKEEQIEIKEETIPTEEVQEEVVEEAPIVEEKPEPKNSFKDIDQATKEKIIDEYLKQAIVNRIEEEKKKQEIILKKIEKEKSLLNFNDDNLEVIDTYLTTDDEPDEVQEEIKEETPVVEEVQEIIPDDKYIDESIVVTDTAYSLIKDIYDEKLEDTGTINTKEINEELSKLEEQILEAPTSSELEKEEEKKESILDKTSLYEQLEEENAIISYDELLKATKFGYTDEEMNNYVDEEDAIISLDEFENLYKEVNKIAKEDSKVDFSKLEMNKQEEEKKFKSSEVISPVYGLHKEEEIKPIISDEDIIKLNDEIKKTNDFLNTLKDLQKNLN